MLFFVNSSLMIAGSRGKFLFHIFTIWFALILSTGFRTWSALGIVEWVCQRKSGFHLWLISRRSSLAWYNLRRLFDSSKSKSTIVDVVLVLFLSFEFLVLTTGMFAAPVIYKWQQAIPKNNSLAVLLGKLFGAFYTAFVLNLTCMGFLVGDLLNIHINSFPPHF